MSQGPPVASWATGLGNPQYVGLAPPMGNYSVFPSGVDPAIIVLLTAFMGGLITLPKVTDPSKPPAAGWLVGGLAAGAAILLAWKVIKA